MPPRSTPTGWVSPGPASPTSALMDRPGLRDDYEHAGRVVTRLLAHPRGALGSPAVTALGACYKQLNSSVGEFGTATLQAATKAIESTSTGDQTYTRTDQALSALERVRDGLAGALKGELEAAAFSDPPIRPAAPQTLACHAIIASAQHLATAS